MTSNELVELSVRALDDKRAENIVVLDVQGISLVADYFIICHGNSEKQVEAIAREVKDRAQENEYPVKRLEGLDQSRWVLIDLGDVIVHIFHKDDRMYYNLEKLWGDAPTLNIESMLT
ncbi:ribosome silencing factor [Bacillus sp. Marseille-Q3570]|uniref:ribosome silencing factor n=1 Tax=Bacillus sp. Marseille-Q3570 TaxID=2963522 RepID=UPI0021B83ADD|nr:ribosome silencing factor [Bacillus sp. Marseille-Q3570]